MGLFRETGTCSICSENDGKAISDGFICKDCLKKGGMFLSSSGIKEKNYSIDLIKTAIDKNEHFKQIQEERKSLFSLTKKINKQFQVDSNNKLIMISDVFIGMTFPTIFSYNEIVDFELLENGESIVKGGVGRAIVGGVLLGGVGAVVGGVTGGKKSQSMCSDMKIRVAVNNYYNENVYISLIKSETKTKSFIYKDAFKTAQEILTILNNAVETSSAKSDDVQTVVNNGVDPYEELKKCKELLDMGIINTDEFEQKKKQLLNL